MLKSSFQNGLGSKSRILRLSSALVQNFCVTAILKPCYTTQALLFQLFGTCKAR